jgi:hypothetical protein
LKQVGDFERKVNCKLPVDVLTEEYRKMEEYLHILPCGCTSKQTRAAQSTGMNLIHSTLTEYLSAPPINLRMNTLDEKRRKKVLLHLESLQNWIATDIDFDESKCYETIKELTKIARVLQQMAVDVSR